MKSIIHDFEKVLKRSPLLGAPTALYTAVKGRGYSRITIERAMQELLVKNLDYGELDASKVKKQLLADLIKASNPPEEVVKRR